MAPAHALLGRFPSQSGRSCCPLWQLLVLAVCGRSISKWRHFGYQRTAGQGGSSKSFDRVLVVERYSLRRGELRFRLSIYKYSNSFLKITTETRSTSETRRSWSCALYLLRCRSLRTMRPPSPTVSTELQWGELRRVAFGTCARVAGSFSISEWSVLLPSGQLLVLAVLGRSISKWQHFGY